MNEIASTNTNQLTIRGRKIRFDSDGLACLNDIWTAAGFTKNNRPGDWQRLPTTIRRIERVLKLITGKSRNYKPDDIRRVVRTRRGADGGTYADIRLALDYAEYLDPALAIEVKEVFIRYKGADPTLADDVLGRASPEANEWAARRAMGRVIRSKYTEELDKRGISHGIEYAGCTNAAYQGLFGKTASEMRKAKAIPKSKSLRDGMDLKELAIVAVTEVLSVERMEDEDSHGFQECKGATAKAALAIRTAFESDRRDRQKRLV